jgi:hypothetical protein
MVVWKFLDSGSAKKSGVLTLMSSHYFQFGYRHFSPTHLVCVHVRVSVCASEQMCVHGLCSSKYLHATGLPLSYIRTITNQNSNVH